MERLVSLLDERRGIEELTIRAFAKKLGISETMYHLVLRGKRQFGSRSLARIKKIYPEYSDAVDEYAIAKMS